jgi:hypothetical protein
MAIETKHVDISEKEYASQQEWAENTKGVYMNLLGGVRWDPTDNKYKMAPIKYSTVPLEGEKIQFGGGQEFIVMFSCLAEEYAHKKEVRDLWWEKANEVVNSYKEQKQLQDHIATNNTDLKRLRKEGLLKTQEELDNEQ